MKMKFKLYTLAFDFTGDYKAVIGFQLDEQDDDRLLIASFTYNGTWRVYKYQLYEFEQMFSDPSIDILVHFRWFLEDLREACERKVIRFRKSRGEWQAVRNIYHEVNPTKIEILQDDSYGMIPKLKIIEKRWL